MKKVLILMLMALPFGLLSQEVLTSISYNMLNQRETLTDGVQARVSVRKHFNRVPGNEYATHIGAGFGYFSYWDLAEFDRIRNGSAFVQAGMSNEDEVSVTGEIAYLTGMRAISPSAILELKPFDRFLWTNWNFDMVFTAQLGVIQRLKVSSSPTAFLSLGIGITKEF